MLWWEQPLSLGPDANIWVAAASRSWEEIGNRVLRSAGVDDATPADIRSTYLEIVNQSLSGSRERSIHSGPQRDLLRGGPVRPSSGARRHVGAYAFEITLGEQGFPLLAVFAPSVANLSDAPVQAAAESRSPRARADGRAGQK